MFFCFQTRPANCLCVAERMSSSDSPNLHENWDWSVCKRIQVLCCSFCYKRKIMLQIYKNFRILYGEMMFIFCKLVAGVKNGSWITNCK